MAGPCPSIIPQKMAWNYKMRALATPLWEHILCAGFGYLSSAKLIIKESDDWTTSGFWSALICICAHDLGKLRKFRPQSPKKYISEQHPEYGAAVLEELIGNRLPVSTKERFVQAVRNHHHWYKEKTEQREYLTAAVILADRLARGKETHERAQEYFKKALIESKS
jgi:hypothetical protein